MVNEQPLRPGVYRWDGQTFRPVAGPGVGRVLLVAAAALVLLLIGVALGRAGASGEGTGTGTGTSTTVASAAPTVAPTPMAPIALSGTGSKVLPVTLAPGRYKVSWTAQGNDNFILSLLGDNEVHLVNEIPPNPSSGETVLTVKDAATYQLQVQAATLTWTITLSPL